MEESRKLKVGDKVVNIGKARWGNEVYYNFDEVERLTNTMAVLKSGTRLINEPRLKMLGKEFEYCVHGDRWVRYEFTTPEIEKNAEVEKNRVTAVDWFNRKIFTDEEKQIIYKFIKEKTK
jgi:hypothetical protein